MHRYAETDAPVREARVPSSKPETQRALLVASLAEGVSRIHNDLRSHETSSMAEACENLGAAVRRHADFLEVTGVGRPGAPVSPIVQAHGSALIFRTFTALASVIPGPTIVTGDETLRRRPMAPLVSALRELGAEVVSIAEEGLAPVAVLSERLEGGTTSVPGNVSSQFVSALLLAAPFARRPTTIRVTGTILSRSYILQTLAAMRHAGIEVEWSDDLRELRVRPGAYRAVDSTIRADYTSASYLLAATALFEGSYVLHDIDEESLQGERAVVDIVRALGVRLEFDPAARTLRARNEGGVLEGDFRFSAEDCPNIIPTLAAIGAFVNGTFTVTGGSVTRLHKSPRIEAMISELRKLEVDIRPLHAGEVLDGFTITGRGTVPRGGAELSAWGDHRIFMSLFIVSARCREPNLLPGGESVALSFPGFFTAFEALVPQRC